jgi:hypothetical protein
MPKLASNRSPPKLCCARCNRREGFWRADPFGYAGGARHEVTCEGARVLVARVGRVPPIPSGRGGWRTEWYGHTHALERVARVPAETRCEGAKTQTRHGHRQRGPKTCRSGRCADPTQPARTGEFCSARGTPFKQASEAQPSTGERAGTQNAAATWTRKALDRHVPPYRRAT